MQFAGTKWSQKETLILGAIFLLALSLMAARINEMPIGANTDDAYYIEMARSIAEGLGPVLNIGPATPVENPNIFPVGFPYLLSPMARVFPESLTIFRIVPFFATLLLFPLCLLLPGPKADSKLKIGLVALVSLNPWVVGWAGRILSDNPFAVVCLACLLWGGRVLSLEKIGKKDWALLIVLAALAVSLRTIGWALVFAFSFSLLFRKRFIASVLFLLSVTFLLQLLLWIGQNNGALFSAAYHTQMAGNSGNELIQLWVNNFHHYLAELPVLLVPVFGGPLSNIFVTLGLPGLYHPFSVFLGLVLLGLTFRGGLQLWHRPETREKIRFFCIFLIIYGSVLLNFDGYPSGVQTRLLIPLLPLLVWFIMVGSWSLNLGFGGSHNSAVGSSAKSLTVFIFIIMIGTGLVHNGWRIIHPLKDSVEDDGSGIVNPADGAKWVLKNTDAEDVVMVQDPIERHIHFRRNVVGFPDEISESGIEQWVDGTGIDWVFVGPSLHFKPKVLDLYGVEVLNILEQDEMGFSLEGITGEGMIKVFLVVPK
ncbi:MAG: hypothetical protein GY780_15150 [bacterium]|nr:hypothetical protein [bacterium]